MDFSKVLINWYLQNKRDLPWRKTEDPYCIWLSEIILQQTRVNQGLTYYEKFITSFPTVFHLAKADEKAVLNLWQGLGYYSRARNLHFSARYIVDELGGKFPNTYKDLLKLKGVGDYTASAIASICYNEPCAVVDGNVYRVLARYFGIETAINSTEGVKIFKKLAQELLDDKDPATFNQAIMEFGATQCKPKNPDCSVCPFQNSCKALAKNEINDLPFKNRKVKVRNRFFNYLVVIDKNNGIILNQRTGNGIWKNLYQFPLIETSKEIDIKELINIDEFHRTVNANTSNISLFNEIPIIHKLTHQHLSVKFWVINSDEEIDNSISISDFEKYPVPILIHKFADAYF
ncbi:A/G-specific adenine glycosylase [Aureibaculum sp. 2210JD6-5]|uniref:A/G-specific adenine glycosylase n=1 Tax=Aureibaculum sp. 2210JD6-5 TaxID=3103957 RepID=UPI002AAD95EE|nr:A/G-specific adenine glycosylase [Aureibaculum sp. 2210JD6-5]MDY7394931.1 A/G-specific adenine glycosylase [Aureibaculum sp. 2210JD6-5]